MQYNIFIMSPRVEEITEALGKETKITAAEQYQIAALFEALEYMVDQINELQREMKNAKRLGKRMKNQEKKKTKITIGEGTEVTDSLELLHEGNLEEFTKIMGKLEDLTGKKRELNESEIGELSEIYSAIFQFQNSLKSLVAFASSILVNMKPLTRLLNIDETAIIKEQTAQQGV